MTTPNISKLYPPSRNTPGVSPRMKAKKVSLRRDFAPDEAQGEDTPTVRSRELHNMHFLRVCIFVYIILSLFLLPSSVHALNITARIGDQYTEVNGGDRLYFEVDIKYPENPRRKDLRIEYQIIENGEIIASEKVLRAVETQASFLDYIVVPKSAKGAIHDLNVIITDYDNLHEEVSATFKILKGIDQVTTYFFIMLGAILLVAVLVIIQILSGRRKSKV